MALVQAWDNMMHAVHLETGESLFKTFTGRPLWAVAGLDDSTWSSPAIARLRGRWMAFAGSYDGKLRAVPLDEEGRRPKDGRSNLWFWLSFPLALIPLAAVAILLSAHERRQRLRRRRSQTRSTASGPAT